jgi:DNA-binding XRE family transcriptional regulator
MVAGPPCAGDLAGNLEYTLKTRSRLFKYSPPMFGGELRRPRLRAGLTQQVLADKAGLHSTYISNLEHDKYSPTLDAIFRICDALGESPARLIGRVD